MSESFNRQQVDDITAPWLNLCKEQEAEIAKLRARIESLEEILAQRHRKADKQAERIEALQAELAEKPLRSEADAMLIESLDAQNAKLQAVVDATVAELCEGFCQESGGRGVFEDCHGCVIFNRTKEME